MSARGPGAVERVAVIGAGAVGLSTAVHLQRSGVEVVVHGAGTVTDRASYGNAGHLVPALAMPLADQANLRYFLTSVIRPMSPVSAPDLTSRAAIRYSAAFLGQAHRASWRRSTAVLNQLNRVALDAFDELAALGIATTHQNAPFTAAFTDAGRARAWLAELAEIAQAGQPLDVRLLDADELRRLEPLCSSEYHAGVQLQGQALVDPPAFLDALTAWLSSEGVSLREDHVTRVVRDRGRLSLEGAGYQGDGYDAVVLAAGAASVPLAREHGFRGEVLSGYGHSVFLPDMPPTRGMLYFPEQRLACTSFRGSLRVSSLMRMTGSHRYEPRSGRDRLDRIIREQFPALSPSALRDRWHGARPLSLDGRPYVGGLGTPGVYLNTGHGMWGVTWGPVTGRLLAQAVAHRDREIAIPGFSAIRR